MSRSHTLNPRQRAVVERLEGPVFVAAGAGSGKTRVLAERFVARVLRDEAVAGSVSAAVAGVLLITFTEKAAGELVERVRRTFLAAGRPDLARAVDTAWISTIHGFCQRVVRRHALDIGLDPGFSVLSETETGLLRLEAFEAAAREARLADPEVAGLLAAHGVAETRAAVTRGLDKVRAMGGDARDLTVPAPARPDAPAESAWADLGGLLEAYAALPPTATVEKNLDATRDLLSRLASLRPFAGRPDLAGDLLAATDGFKLAAQGGEAMRELTMAVRETVEDLRAVASEALAARQAAAFKTLMTRYAAAFEARKRARNGLDFEDLQIIAARLFEERPETARRYERQFSTVMVDEFQDTNEMQMRVLRPLSAGKLCVVGDDKQSIYGFRYADVAVFRSERDALAAGDDEAYHELSVNYRTAESLLETVNCVFGAPALFGDDFLRLRPGRARATGVRWPDGRPRAELLVVDKPGWSELGWREAEARALASRLAAVVSDGIGAPGDIVVLLRAMTTASTYIRAIEACGLDVYADAAGGFFGTRELADVRWLLRVLADAKDGEAVVGLLAGGFGGLSDDALLLLSAAAGRHGDLWAALGSPGEAGLSDREAARARLVHDVVRRARERQGRSELADTLLDVGEALGPGGGCFEGEGAWANIRKVARLAAAYERVAPGDPAAFLRYLDDHEAHAGRERSAGIAVEGVDAVRVMSIHAAKGLEFPIVAVADLGHGEVGDTSRLVVTRRDGRPAAAVRLPASFGEAQPPAPFVAARDVEHELAVAEAKRVLYVGCTRAEEALIVSGATDLSKGGDRPIDWLIDAIGLPGGGGPADEGDGIRRSIVTCGDESSLSEARPGRARPRASAGTDPGTAPAPASEARLEAPEAISYSALSLFGRCPYRFFAERILGLGALPDGGDRSSARGIGSALHAALEGVAGGTAADEATRRAARTAGLEEVASERLRRAVGAWAGSGLASRARERTCRPEVPFAVPLAGRMLVGTMDLYARPGTSAGAGADPAAAALIIDYKTGSGPLEADAARRRFELQAACYALAAFADGATAVEASFVELEREGRVTTFRFEGDDRHAIAERLTGLFARIADGPYPTLDRYEPEACGECAALGSLCAVRRPAVRSR